MTDRQSSATAPRLRRPWRLAIVLIASVLVATAQPLAAGLFSEQGWFDVCMSLLIGAVLLQVFEAREHRRIAVALAAAALIGVWLSLCWSGEVGRWMLVGAYVVAAGFFVFALSGILRGILVRQASGRVIFGAACGYLLLGIIWSLLYYAIETAAPGSFRGPPSREEHGVAMPSDRGLLSYYSFITLATVGYGDVTPITPLARTLAWLEAITGQLYLAILVAGLVGFKVAQAMRT
jgi:voltage-gated potassium channel